MNRFLKSAMLRVAAVATAVLLGIAAQPADAQFFPTYPQPNYKNLLDNPRLDIAQRSTATQSAVTTTATYLWDRWAGYASNSGASLTMTNITSGLPNNFVNAAQIQRANTNTNTTPVCMIQEIPTADSYALAGQPVALSLWALAGGNFSAASSNLTLSIIVGQGTDEGISKFAALTGTGMSTLSFNQPITTTWTRYGWTTTIPAGTTEIAVDICFTPSSTAAGTADYFQATGIQLEQGTTPTAFEQRPQSIELWKAWYTYYQVNEGSSSGLVALCDTTDTNIELCAVPLPRPMRLNALAASTITITTGAFKAKPASGSFVTWSSPTASVSTGNYIAIQSFNTSTAGNSMVIYGGSAGGGKIAVSADF